MSAEHLGAVFKYGGPSYKEWADGQVNKIKGILNAARADHTEAVKTRIESVQELGSVVDITKTLLRSQRYVVDAMDYGCQVAHVRVGNCSTRGQGLSSSSRPPLLPRKQSPFWIHGFATRDK